MRFEPVRGLKLEVKEIIVPGPTGVTPSGVSTCALPSMMK
jgi:hypothetical protein